ncbi:MAG: hypothetical protein HC800_24245 [Phormidesmis sp. RL_2_1]|nr:hypothetical protein [Phormidesmis sp. RL_2_1]
MKNSRKFINRFGLAMFTLSFIMLSAHPSHALILDPAREAIASDLASAGWEEGTGMDGFLGLIELLLLAIPVASGIAALTQLNRGAEGWMPWLSLMGASIVFLGFVTFMVGRIYS